MAFNRKAKLRDNIEAIRTAFELGKAGRAATPDERERLARYCGFGGLKCILNPAATLTDAVQWAKSDLELFPLTVELHRLIRENSANENEYKRYIDSLKSSVLTAFYTPSAVTEALADVLHDYNVRPHRLLEPSAGHGAFVEAFLRKNAEADVMAFEKDLLTGKILSCLYPDKKVRAEGFERIEKPFNGYFDAAVSNIPFGDVAVFDPAFSASESVGRRNAAKAIHNYFFLKGLDAVRDGGIVAFITSQGVMNATRNEAVRLEMLKGAHLVSAIRLPNNLFADHAGTEVGSDLVVLQKDTRKEGLTEDEKLFIQTGIQNGVSTNRYFIEHGEQIVHTSAKLDTDPYGKPAMVYQHDGGVEGIATQLRELLDDNLHARLVMRLYSGGIRDARLQEQQAKAQTTDTPLRTEPTAEDLAAFGAWTKEKEQRLWEERTPKATDFEEATVVQETVQPPTAAVQQEAERTAVPAKEEKPEIEPPVMSLYDLFGFTAEERRIAQTGGKPRRRSNRPKLAQPRQPSLFDTPTQATATTIQAEQTAHTPTETAARPAYPVENAAGADMNRRIADVERQIREDEARLTAEERQRRHEEEMKPRPFDGLLEPHHREGSFVKVNPVDAEKYAKEAIQAGVLEDKDILINKSYSNELRRMMDWLDSGIGSSIVAFMNGYNDPRRPLYFTTNVRHLVKKTAEPTGEKDQNNEDIYNESDILIRKGAQYIGVPVGCELGNKNGGNDNQRVYYSFLAGGYATPQPIMFAAEGWFLRAEAKLRWTDAGQQSVKELYEKGIEVSIRNQKSYRQSDAAAAWTEKKLTAPDWAAIDDAAISSYINDDTSSPEGYTDPWKPEYNSDPTTSITVKWDEGASNEEKLERIITQKWIANFPLSTEAWADYRRTGYPKLFRPKQNLAPSIIDTQLGPRRLLYNETELSSNTVEVNNAIQLLKAESSEVKGDGDTGGTRLWWDRKDKGNF